MGYHNEGKYESIYRHLKQLNGTIDRMYQSTNIGLVVQEGIDSLVLLCYREGIL